MKHKLKLALILGVEFIAIAIVLILIFFSGKKQYTVVFDIDGGILLSGNLEQKVTQGHSANPPSVAKEGHYLRGWSGNYREITHNIEIKAIWEYETTPGIVYNEIEGATYTEIVSCYEYLSGKVYIGAYHNDLKVLAITDSAFEGRSKITDLYLLDGILKIGKRAFANCTEMVSIDLPDTTLKIENEAFYGCSSLESIKLPENIEELGAKAFMGCSSLTEVLIPSTIKKIDESAFEGCANLRSVVFYEVEDDKYKFDDEPEKPDKNVSDAPSLVIGTSAFQNCTALESINLPETLHTLQTYAFSGCTSLTHVVIPKNTQKIANAVFDSNATTVHLYFASAAEIPSTWAPSWASGTVTKAYGYTGGDFDGANGDSGN